MGKSMFSLAGGSRAGSGRSFLYEAVYHVKIYKPDLKKL